jgi:hypothetical protein
MPWFMSWDVCSWHVQNGALSNANYGGNATLQGRLGSSGPFVGRC